MFHKHLVPPSSGQKNDSPYRKWEFTPSNGHEILHNLHSFKFLHFYTSDQSEDDKLKSKHVARVADKLFIHNKRSYVDGDFVLITQRKAKHKKKI